MKRISTISAVVCMCVAFLQAQPSQTPTLSEMAGQMICIGIGDAKYHEQLGDLRKEIALGAVGSVILFQKNIATENAFFELKDLINSLQQAAKIPLWVGIDEEGGRVSRLHASQGFIHTYSAQKMGTHSPEFTYEQSYKMAQQLKSLGINLNFAPVLDVAIEKENVVIVKNNRSFSDNPRQVAKHALAFIEAHQAIGILTVAKHFPGHGSSIKDTHLGLVDVSNTWTHKELIPYKSLINKNSLPIVMTAHIINENLDKDKLPASLSKNIVQGLLREELGFQGVVFSDDMHMSAIRDHYSMKEVVTLSIASGVDVLMFTNNVWVDDRVKATKIRQLIVDLVRDGEVSRERIEESYQRIMQAKSYGK